MWLNLMTGFKLLILGINILYQKGKSFFFFSPLRSTPRIVLHQGESKRAATNIWLKQHDGGLAF